MKGLISRGAAILTPELLRYLIVGAWNTLLGFSLIFICMRYLGLNPFISNAIGYGIGFINSFALNRRFTFRSKGHVSHEFAKFGVAFAIAYLLNLATLKLCLDVLSINKYIAQLIAASAYVLTSYLLSKFYVFSDPSDSSHFKK